MPAPSHRLATAIEDLAAFLRTHGETTWADQLDRDAELVRHDDARGVDRFLAKFGGMGRLNDLVFHPLNANVGRGQDPADVNRTFDALREHAWELAREARGASEPPR